jgi:hypothetical protein
LAKSVELERMENKINKRTDEKIVELKNTLGQDRSHLMQRLSTFKSDIEPRLLDLDGVEFVKKNCKKQLD